MKKAIFAGIFIGLFCIFSGVEAQNLPENLKFKRFSRKKQSLTLKNCPLIPNVRKFEVSAKGKKLGAPLSQNRKIYSLPSRFSFFACSTVDGVTTLYAKSSANGAVTGFTFTADDFPKLPKGSGLSKACPKGTRGFGGGMLYKPAADASDARQGKPVILFTGSSKTRSSAIKIFASNGNEICRFTFKSSSIPGVNGGADHYFSGWTGGCGKSSSQIAAAARSATGNSNIYIEWKGGQCLGPVNPFSRTGGI